MIIGVWGDSIVYGSGDVETLGWVGRLRKSLPTDVYHEVHNRGICGETSRDLLVRFGVEVRAIQPDSIIIAIGLNDTKYQAGAPTPVISLDTYRKNLKKLLRQAREYTDQVYFVGLTKVDEGWRSKKGSMFQNADVVQYDTCCREVANEVGIPFISVFDLLSPDRDLADKLHPNAQGYQKMFDVIRRHINLPN